MDLRGSKEASGWNTENAWESVRDNIRKLTGGWIVWCFIGHCKGFSFCSYYGTRWKAIGGF